MALRHISVNKPSLAGHYLKFISGALFLGLQESFYLCIKPDGGSAYSQDVGGAAPLRAGRR